MLATIETVKDDGSAAVAAPAPASSIAPVACSSVSIFEFGASVHRIVSLDLVDDVFEPATAVMREQWAPRLDLLIEELVKAPATLRLSYVADREDAGLVERRIAAVESEVARRWAARSQEKLPVESETYWRRGAPFASSLVSGIGEALVDAVVGGLEDI